MLLDFLKNTNDHKEIIAVLTVLRQMYSEVNLEKFCCFLTFKQTEIFAIFDKVIEDNTNNSQVINLEMLWLLFNIAYCCEFDKELDYLGESLLNHSSLRKLLVDAL